MAHLHPARLDPTRAELLQAVVAGTSILTAEGELPVDYLQPGDRVVTRAGMRVLRQVEVALVQNARLVRIAHETLGVDRPASDLLVSVGQMVLVRDWRAQALAGVPAALFPAARLADGEYIRCLTLPEARLFTLVFDEEAIVYAGGLELVCPAMADC
jgi:Hint domain